MFENFMVVVVIIIVLWLIGFGLYLYTSRQQQDLAAQIDSLKEKLDAEGQNAKN